MFDEVDLYQHQGRIDPKGAHYFLNRVEGFTGKRSVEIVSDDKTDSGKVVWQPTVMDASRTDALQFAYRKLDPDSTIGLKVEFENGAMIDVAEDGLTIAGGK